MLQIPQGAIHDIRRTGRFQLLIFALIHTVKELDVSADKTLCFDQRIR